MTAPEAQQDAPRDSFAGLKAAASIAIVLAALKAAAPVFVPLVFALFLVILALPLLAWLRRRGLPTWLAMVLTLGLLAAVVFGLGFVVVVSVSQVSELAPQYQARIEVWSQELEPLLTRFGLDVADTNVAGYLDVERLFSLASGALSRLTALVWFLLLVLLITVFTFVESLVFRDKLAYALGEDNGVVERFGRITRDVQQYLLVKTAISLATGAAVGIWLWIVGVDLPVLWGLLTFLLNYIPNVGQVAAAVPPVLLAFLQLGPGRALAAIAGFLVVNVVIGNIIEPNLMGRRLGLAPVVVLISLVFWGWMWGMVGTLIAVPLTMMIKILLENSENLGWIAKLMGPKPRGVEGKA